RTLADVYHLTLTELEALSRSRHAVLLALLGARVPRQESLGLQLLAQLGVVLDQRAGDAESHGAGLSRDAAAIHRRQDVELVGGLGEDERGLDLRPEGFGREERVERPVVDGDGAAAGPEEHAGGRCLAATRPVILHCCHVTRPRAWRVSAPRADDPDRRTL